MKKIFLTGRPLCGKTTLVKKIVNKLTNSKIYGFYTEEILDKNKRVGFSIVSYDGQKGILAHVNNKSQYEVGKYKVDVDVLEDIGANALIKGKINADIIILDEIGKMELFSELVKLSIIEILGSDKTLIATIADNDDPFIGSIKTRDDVDLILVTAENRDSLEELILKKLRD